MSAQTHAPPGLVVVVAGVVVVAVAVAVVVDVDVVVGDVSPQGVKLSLQDGGVKDEQ